MGEIFKKKQLTVVYGPLLHYRVPLLTALAEKYNLRVFATSYSDDPESLDFKLCVVPPKVIFGFEFQVGLRKHVRNSASEACIVFLDLYNVSALSLIFRPPLPRSIIWGAWKTNSWLANAIRTFAVRHSDTAIFYCQEHLNQFRDAAPDSRLFVAQNTVLVPSNFEPSSFEQRRTLLFVGSLTRRKGLDRLLRVFADICLLLDPPIKLILVGDGPEREALTALVHELDISASVELKGKITDPGELESFYRKALASVSLNQAGLSVLQSMGFGVPFVTLTGCVSGGEITNIIDGVNGYLLPDDDLAIQECLMKLCRDPKLSEDMGRAARGHYLKYATMENYAQGISDAVEGTRDASVWQS